MRGFVGQSALGFVALFFLGIVLESLVPSAGRAGSPSGPLIQVLGGGVNFIVEIASQVGWLILPVTAGWLLIRGLRHLVAFVVVVALGLAMFLIVGPLLTSLLERLIGDYFPRLGSSGLFTDGSIAMIVTGAVLLLVYLPVIPYRARVGVISAVIACLAAFDGIRVAATPVEWWVVAGAWLLGLGWVGVSALAFRGWQQSGRARRPLHQGLFPRNETQLEPAPVGDKALPDGVRGSMRLLGAWLLIGVVLTGAGLLITQLLVGVQRFDEQVVAWFVDIRSDGLTAIAAFFGAFGATPGIVAALLIVAPLCLAITGRWAPTVFLMVAVVGETSLFLAAAYIVGRSRPAVDHLSQVPPTPSFPSGHVAAAVAVYGAVALILWAWGPGFVRYTGVVLAPVIALGVTFGRLYGGEHFPSDVIASILFAALWLGLCWHAVKPYRGAPRTEAGRGSDRPSHRDAILEHGDRH